MRWTWLNPVHPGLQGGVDGCSQLGSGKPGIAPTLAHAPLPANGQRATKGTPAHQLGSQKPKSWGTAADPFYDSSSQALL